MRTLGPDHYTKLPADPSLTALKVENTIPFSVKFGEWSERVKNNLNAKNAAKYKKRLAAMARVNKIRFEQIRKDARQEAQAEFKTLFINKLFVAGLMIYAGEGDSKVENSVVRVVNTDPRMIKTFHDFSIQVCKVNKKKIKYALVLYPDLNDRECKLFWRKIVKIPLHQFHKTQYIKGRHPTNRLKNGICYVIVSSRELKEKILVWIGLCYKNL